MWYTPPPNTLLIQFHLIFITRDSRHPFVDEEYEALKGQVTSTGHTAHE